jgi:very-short-patch-repair endonuclease
MLFSPVISERAQDSALFFLRKTSNLFNVAATRARSALIIVGDRRAAQKVDYLGAFEKFVAAVLAEHRNKGKTLPSYGPDYPRVSRPELVSDWEKILYQALYRAGLRPLPQYDVEKYILDFALFGGDRKLNIEVDGERYHRSWDGELCRRDQIRNMRLIELGWDVMRFWVYQVRDELPQCVARVAAWHEEGRAESAEEASLAEDLVHSETSAT